MLVTNDDELSAKVRHLRGQGVSPTRTYWHDVVGFNYRMTNIAAAIGYAQLERIEETLAAKRKIAGWYNAGHEGVSGLTVQAEAPWVGAVYWMNCILVDPTLRDSLMAQLASEGIETRPFFYPAHTLPMYESQARFPVAERLGASGINLPSYAELEERQVPQICTSIRPFVETRRA
jgi:perosamine synthetase